MVETTIISRTCKPQANGHLLEDTFAPSPERENWQFPANAALQTAFSSQHMSIQSIYRKTGIDIWGKVISRTKIPAHYLVSFLSFAIARKIPCD